MAALVAILTVVLIGVLAFVTDFGFAYANQRSLQNASDAAVLAAGERMLENALPGQSCTDIVNNALSDAQNDAQQTFLANAGSGASLAGNSVDIRCDDSALPGQIVVSASASQQSPSFFGRIFGHSQYPLTKNARAVIGPALTLVGVRPFALCDQLGNLAESQPDAYVTVNFTNADQGCGSASGNFGILDMRNAYTPPAGPTGPNGCPGASVVGPWISSGYPDEIPASSPLFIEGNPGGPASDYAPYFNDILDTPIVIPTYDVMTGSGCSTSVYHITGFIEAKLCGYRLTSGAGALSPGACFDAPSMPSDPHDRFAQLKFTRFIPVGALNVSCKINDACDHGPKLLKLAQ